MASTALGLLLPSSVSAQEDGPSVFQPTNSWTLDSAQNSCSLHRTFQSPLGSVFFQIEQYSPGDDLTLTVASSDIEVDQSRVSVRFDPDDVSDEPAEAAYGAFGGEQYGVRFTSTLLPASVNPNVTGVWPVIWSDEDRADREASIEGMSVAGVFEQPFFLHTGSLSNEMSAMRTCLASLLDSWGFDPEIGSKVAINAQPRGLRRWLRRVRNAYPREMVSRGRDASVRVVLAVGTDGRVTQCQAHNPEPFPIFETAVCRALLEHARYDPALDADGNPVSGFSSMTFAYSAR